jgi:DNA (cytosine-5)-methyltransferase 1
MSRPRGFIDLFAGCGGLALGLERAGFHPVFVNEVCPDALATYLENRAVSAPLLTAPDLHAGDIKSLVLRRGELERLSRRIAGAFGIDARAGDLDLVVGGLPSPGIPGHHQGSREPRAPHVHLHEDMVFVVASLRPKLFLCEGVKGLLSARWTAEGERGEVWREIVDLFRRSLPGYRMEWRLVRVQDYGVPQRGTRVLLAGIRSDIAHGRGRTTLLGGLLPEPSNMSAPDPIDVLGDLVDPSHGSGLAMTCVYPAEAASDLQRSFRVDPATGAVRRKGAPITEHEYARVPASTIEAYRFMLLQSESVPAALRNKIFSTCVVPRYWNDGGPTITKKFGPRDCIHFSQPRTLTVREWARLQTFPDWYGFRGRPAEKYRQVANAFPVALAMAVGRHFARLLGD